ANEAMAADNGSHREERPRDTAQTFLGQLLAGGPVPSTQVKTDTEAAGLSWATVRRAQDALGVVPRQEGKQWGWELALNLRCSDAHLYKSEQVSTCSPENGGNPTQGGDAPPEGEHLTDAEAAFDERAAIREYNGGQARAEAEAAAAEELGLPEERAPDS